MVKVFSVVSFIMMLLEKDHGMQVCMARQLARVAERRRRDPDADIVRMGHKRK